MSSVFQGPLDFLFSLVRRDLCLVLTKEQLWCKLCGAVFGDAFVGREVILDSDFFGGGAFLVAFVDFFDAFVAGLVVRVAYKLRASGLTSDLSIFFLMFFFHSCDIELLSEIVAIIRIELLGYTVLLQKIAGFFFPDIYRSCVVISDPAKVSHKARCVVLNTSATS